MELTMLLSRVFGPLLLIAAVAIITRRKEFMRAVSSAHNERFTQHVGGILAIFVGLLLINIHHDWSAPPAILISFFGWFILGKGILYIYFPEAHLAKLIGLTEERWYTLDAILAFLFGLYLTCFGYGFF